ncbi:2-dehydro-3-deoxygalactonokinase [Polycladidibacter hongkongensis]|uniref:2-dehydro-3-deoxygalactonokinase n=1 Tax=Polycladidibacter hongkongensis TaxID=1647556 RepID=UPI0009ECAB79|nr:2-dehydro-3-deoxygalactonokinase [Pseudovibrio hongkongensis]
MTKAALIAVDWGTSSFRARTIDADLNVIDLISTDEGILKAKGQFEQVFASNLRRLDGFQEDLPIVMSGMIGSRNGWVEVPYMSLPAHLSDLSGQTGKITLAGFGPITLVPGVMARGQAADVMRGEETELFGAIQMLDLKEGRLIIPGSHSKHVVIKEGAIFQFNTFLTGELFHALTNATILGAFGKEVCPRCPWFDQGVIAGAQEGDAGALLGRLFSARARVLVDGMPEKHAACYLSGMLIGAELCATHQQSHKLWILGNGKLPHIYQQAATLLDINAQIVPEGAAVAGAVQIAKALGLAFHNGN